MAKPILPSLTALALMGGAVGAQAEDLRWDAQGTASHVFTVAPRSEHAACSRLAAGERVVWAFVAQGPVDFSVRDARTRQVVGGSSRSAVREARDALEVTRPQAVCWAWVNRGTADIQVSLQLRKH
ncbi:MAG: hypothetical protein KatS3mg122_1945 [Caldimonas sp.]|uniref:hypothetical protein n=1 Tax=Caldimonas taiwanensis TaxID=307483 RepID=UPI0012FC018F|nr:hypothetical protein [Caldimonas taiwanensis]GIX24714.1 MAG: hypothetical protein KatS3mg122_1945 [Caldimonas sp.]